MKVSAYFALGLTLLLLRAAAAAPSSRAACSLLTKTEVEAALGEPVAEPRSETISRGSATFAEVSKCQFDPAHPATETTSYLASLTARFSPVANSSAEDEVRTTLKRLGVEEKEIAGVGDKALWMFIAGGRFSSAQLNVFSKGTVYLLVTIIGISDEHVALEKAKMLAIKALGRI